MYKYKYKVSVSLLVVTSFYFLPILLLLFVIPQDSLEGMNDELSRVGPTLQRYAQFTSRPSVSFAQDSPDSPLTAQAFLSQMECSEDGQLKVNRGAEAEWNQLGMTTSVHILRLDSYPVVLIETHTKEEKRN